MKFGENSLVSSFPPRPDTELPGFAAFFKDLGPRGCKASSGTTPPPQAQPSLPGRSGSYLQLGGGAGSPLT